MKILFTGGVTGGHFYPIIAIAKKLKEISSEEKMLPPELYFMAPDPYDERLLFENDIKFVTAPSGKIRRYFSVKNFFDLFVTFFGVIKAIFQIFSIYPDVIFGKGGYGSFPALFAGRIFGIPVIIHESDTSPGKVNTWASKFAKRIAVSYPETAKFFPEDKTAWTGQPIRDEIMLPIKEGAKEFLKLEDGVPTILILGGSQGAERLNDAILDALPDLVPKYQIIHQTGTNKFRDVVGAASVALEGNSNSSRYKPFAYLNELAIRMCAGASDIVITRAGSTLFEIATWGIPAIVIPIPEDISRDQTGNAYAYARSGAGIVVEEKNLTPKLLSFEIDKLITDGSRLSEMKQKANEFAKKDAASKIARAIFELAREHEK